MQNYIITPEEKELHLERYPVLHCKNSFGVDYDGYISIKCTLLTATCSYANATKNGYSNCKLLTSNTEK